MIRVLVVEDSEVVRRHLCRIIERDGTMRVVGEAADGLDAIGKARALVPDVITMDINMPGMDGLEATRRIMETVPAPIVIVTASYEKADVEKSFLAVEAGAVAVIEKPAGLGSPGYADDASKLAETVRLMSEVKVVRRWPSSRRTSIATRAPVISARSVERPRLVVVGASTGGPPVIQTILAKLNGPLPAPMAVVQHIAKGFLPGMVDWLNQTTGQAVSVAGDMEQLLPGRVYFAPDGFQMGVDERLRARLAPGQPNDGLCPSAAHLFKSAVDAIGGSVVGVLLTGMGKDGAEELRLLKRAGAVTMAQDKASSVVYGMPGEAVRLEAASYVLNPDAVAAALDEIFERKASR